MSDSAPAITFATREDVAAILEIANWAAAHLSANFATQPERLEDWQRTWEQTQAMYPWLVAKDGSEVVGFAKAGPHRPRGAYAWTAEVTVYLRPEWHGKGLGKALYARLIALLRAQGYVTLLGGITSPNPASERLHESFGFVRCALFHRMGWKFDRWWDVGYWELQLRAGAQPPAIRPVAEVA
jgi:L-amino acid N-acyltransferase YncA